MLELRLITALANLSVATQHTYTAFECTYKNEKIYSVIFFLKFLLSASYSEFRIW